MARNIPVLDASWLYVESREAPMHVGSMAIFTVENEPVQDAIARILTWLRSSVEFNPPFNYRLNSPKLLTLRPKWVETDKVDLDYHFRHSALPAPGGERELGALISRLHSHPLDFHRPLWEMHLIEGLQGNRFALYTKMHHSLMDGVGAMRLMSRIFGKSAKESLTLPAPWSVGTVRKEKKSKAPPPFVDQAMEAWKAAKLNGAAISVAGKALRALFDEAFKPTDTAIATPFSGPKSILNGRVGGARRLATQTYPLERIRKLAEAAEVSVNDIFLAICSASLRRYLVERNALPHENLTAGLPVSVRPADDLDGGNAISFILANLNTTEEDPLVRLREINRSTQVAKTHLQSMPKEAINNYTIMLMAPMMLQLVSGLGGLTRPIFNTVISNVPGPSQDLYFSGCRLAQFYPISLIPHGQALNITVVSYAGQFNVAFTGDHDALPSMQRLAVYTGEALEELEGLLGVSYVEEPSSTPATKPVATRAAASRRAAGAATKTAAKTAAKTRPKPVSRKSAG
ncbi:wax ester/triacylglycerol synthase family O-acyltransferase [Limnobacter humi]|uniref:diacylglycerol O-acyltransferase n=1 Tax=Limnobacter humi TaxID=1778671 RepID=A0ABT1WH37_9BURK|nr:wax ester/triacylglycerol synthase family O-acyltransferase [Limnobacter humi]MCQ8896836.1 wax ester/triacylglycerol synthase family O-acyltransferase [Limnobacter humi]